MPREMPWSGCTVGRCSVLAIRSAAECLWRQYLVCPVWGNIYRWSHTAQLPVGSEARYHCKGWRHYQPACRQNTVLLHIDPRLKTTIISGGGKEKHPGKQKSLYGRRRGKRMAKMYTLQWRKIEKRNAKEKPNKSIRYNLEKIPTWSNGTWTGCSLYPDSDCNMRLHSPDCNIMEGYQTQGLQRYDVVGTEFRTFSSEQTSSEEIYSVK